MKILHTGDLHLGKQYHEQSLLADQKEVADFLLNTLSNAQHNNDPYDAFILAGDIYDKSIPSIEASQLLDDLLTRIQQNHPNLSVFIVAGNHDSARRLSFGRAMFRLHKIYIATQDSHITAPVVLTDAGKMQVVFYQIPFLTQGFFGDVKKTQAELTKQALDRIKSYHAKYYNGLPAVLTAHLFAQGAAESASERTSLGTAEQVAPSLFDCFSYTALGHLHRCQQCAESVYYAGSPFPYSFEESAYEKYVLDITLSNDSTQTSNDIFQSGFTLIPAAVQKIPVQTSRRLFSFADTFDAFYSSTKYAEYAAHYLEFALTDSSLIENTMALLKPKFPHLLSIKQAAIAAETNRLENRRILFERKTPDPNVLFEAFINDIYEDTEINEDEKTLRKTEAALFQEMYQEIPT